MYEKLNEILFKMLNEQTQDSIDISQLSDTNVRKLISLIYAKLKNIKIDKDSDELLSKIPTKIDKFKIAVIQLLLIGMKLKIQKSNIKLPAKVFEIILETFEIDGKSLFKVLNVAKFNSLVSIFNITTDTTESSLIKKAPISESVDISEILSADDLKLTPISVEDFSKFDSDMEQSKTKTEDQQDIPSDDESELELDQKLSDSPNFNIINNFWNKIKNRKITLANFETQLKQLSNFKKNTGISWLMDKEDTEDENVKHIVDNLQTYLIVIFLIYLVRTNEYNFNTFRNIILRFEKQSETKGGDMKVEKNANEQYVQFGKKYHVDEDFSINGELIKSGSVIEVINEDPLMQHQMNMLDFGLNPDNPVFQTDRAKIKPEYISWMIKWMGKVLQEDSDKWLQFFEMVLQMMNIKVVNKADTFSEMLKIIYKNFQEESDQPNK